MARKIKISSSILNVRLHPHSEDVYRQFIQACFDLKSIVKIHGDRHGIISLIDRGENDATTVSGNIATFVKLDTDGSWFDAEKLSDATTNQISELYIPSNLYPNAANFYFTFDLKKHRLYVQSYSKGKLLTPQQALSFFNTLASKDSIVERFGFAKITLVQSQEALKKLFGIERLDRVQITIAKPNSDILADDFEAQIEGHLAETNSRQVTFIYQAEPGKSLQPDKTINELSETALTNGHVEVSGRDNNLAVKKSTADMPKVLQSTYDPDTTLEQQAFRRLVNESGNS